MQLHNSSFDCAKGLFKPLKDSASVLLAMKKNLGFVFFVSDATNALGSGYSGWGFRALNPNRKREVFRSRFYWKLDKSLRPMNL